MNDVICFDINLSKTLDIADKTLIGRKFFFAVVSPVLNTGDTSAFLRLSGNKQLSVIEFAILITSPKHKVDNFFKIVVGMLPLTDFETSSRWISSQTSFVSNLPPVFKTGESSSPLASVMHER